MGHLESVRAFHAALSYTEATQGSNSRLSDMEAVKYQALLMEAGGEVLKAIKAGDMVEVLVGLVDLAYVALAAIAIQGGEVTSKSVAWQQDGFVLSVMQVITDKVNACSSGDTDGYSAVYCLCVHLTRGFVNADFDKAFNLVHLNNIVRAAQDGGSFYSDSDNFRKLKLKIMPDLSECLYE
jgi:Phosphoribosyl-ATP pyrophosphohydrolase